MAQKAELEKLKPEQLKKLADKYGVKTEGVDSHSTLAGAVSAKITPEQLVDFKKAEGLDHSDEPAPSGVQSPQAPAPAPGDAKVVDHSAPADNNIDELKSGDREDEKKQTPALSDQQPGDPKVKTTSEDGTVTERDAQPEDLDKVATPEKSENDDEVLPANGDDDGQKTDEDAEPVVKLKNPSGKVVDALESDVVKRHMFAAGFKLIDGEDYSDEIKNEHEAYLARLKASGLSDGVDRGATGQSMAHVDVERRKGGADAPKTSPQGAAKSEEAKTSSTPAKTPQRSRNSRAGKALGN